MSDSSKNSEVPSSSKEHDSPLNYDYVELICNTGDAVGFKVIPKTDCPHLGVLTNSIKSDFQFDEEAGCAVCQSVSENWICLICSKVGCSKYVAHHMEQHNKESGHQLVLSIQDLSVWCYECEAYIDSPILHYYVNAAHVSKFGLELPWSYGPNLSMEKSN